MADLKISQLPAATTPLAGTEVLPIVQSGTTKQATITNVLAGAASLGANTFTAAQNWATGTAVASASTINLDTTTGNRVHITGTTAITVVTLTRGPRTVIFDGVLTLTHNATTNNLPGAANITTAAGDRAIYESDGTTVYCVSYNKVSGTSVVAPPAAGFTLGTPVATTSGTSITFTGIPAGTKQIFVMFRSVSTDSGSRILVQIGDAGGIETTGYLGARARLVDAASPVLNSNTEGFETSYNDGSFFIHGQIIISLENSTNNIWVASGVIGTTNGDQIFVQGNSKALSQELDRLRITTQTGTANFDNGEVNISYI